MTIVIFWIAFSILVGVFASVRRSRSAGGWFLLSLVISPLLAGILLAILREVDTKAPPVGPLENYPDFDDLPAHEQRRLMQLRLDMLQRRQG